MSGINPYIAEPEYRLPQLSYRVTFLPEGKTLEVIPGEGHRSEDGLPGSLLSLALGAGLDLDHSCGGVCACSTCHVYVREGLDSCNEATEDEEDMLDVSTIDRQRSWTARMKSLKGNHKTHKRDIETV